MPIRKTRDPEDKSMFMPSAMSAIIDTEPYAWNLDPEVKKLQKLTIDDTPDNREALYWMESVAISFGEITVSVIIGDGLHVNVENTTNDEKAEKIINEFNTNINVRHESIEDYIHDSYIDNLIHRRNFNRILRENKWIDSLVDMQRLDPKTIEVVIDPVYGWRKFVQHIPKYKHHRSQAQFYREAESKKLYSTQLRPTYITGRSDKETYSQPVWTSLAEVDVEIPDDINNILYTSLFNKPPISAALRYIKYKQWILLFMKKYSQKYWAPFVVAKVGDPKSNNYPSDPAKMQKALEKTSQIIKNMTAFGYLAVPGDIEVETLETNTARSAEIYPMYIQELDKQIMYALFGSMGQREARGTELATSRILERGWLRFVKGVRRKYEILLTKFYANCLLPAHGITNVDPTDIDIEWSRLRMEETKDLMEAIQIGYNIGLFKDQNELRKAAQSIFSFLDEIPGGDTLPEPPVAAQTRQLESLYEEYVNDKQNS